MRDNIVHLALIPGCVRNSPPVYQYDYGQQLILDGLDLPTAYEVHFANGEHSESVTQIGGADGVTIPDMMLTSGAPVHVWLYLHTGTDDGETVLHGMIPVIRRAQPSDMEPTPVQQDAITQAIAALNDAVETTGQDVIDANAAKDAAENSATSAETNALKSEGYAVGRQNGQAVSSGSPYYNNNAFVYRTQAQTAQREAVSAKNDAQTAKTGAETAKRLANDAKTDAIAAKKDAEAYAIGKRGGTDVASDDPAYHNNSKYYAEQAAEVLSDKVDITQPDGDAAAVYGQDSGGDTCLTGVATLADMQEIIDGYGNDGVAFEIVFDDTAGLYVSVDDAEDIIAAYLAGKHVVLYFKDGGDEIISAESIIDYDPEEEYCVATNWNSYRVEDGKLEKENDR